MPVRVHYLEAFGFNVVRLEDPFEMEDLASRARADLADGLDPAVFVAPLLLDFRAIDLLRFETEDMRRLIRRRQELDVGQKSGPCAYLAEESGSFGMLRMYAAYAEILGLRDDNDSIVTMEIGEAIDWLSRRLDLPEASVPDILRAVEAVVAQPD
ncbi:MAG: hypothetical protein QNJ09_11655 [Paracoccaceae bacterium]|nr:hypothetical protein [Paracoccaceae bacterium]